MVQKLYKDPTTPTDQRLYCELPDLTSDIPGTELEGNADNDPFTINGVLKIYESQKALVDINSYLMTYDADVLKWWVTIPSIYFTQYSTGFIFFTDTRTGPITIDFEVCYPDNYVATFDQVAAIATVVHNQDVGLALANYGVPTETSLRADISSGLANYGVPTETSLQADISNGLNTYGVPKLSQLNNVSTTQILTQMGTGLTNYGAAKTSDVTGATSGLATSANLASASSNISLIKAKTDLLTLENINTQSDIAITDAGIVANLLNANTNLLSILSAVNQVNSPSFITSIWSASTRTLTSSSGTGEGASIDEISVLIDQKQLATYAELTYYFASLNEITPNQVYTQIDNAITNRGIVTNSTIGGLLTPLATQASLTGVASNVSTILSDVTQITLPNIRSQVTGSLIDNSIPGSLTSITNVINGLYTLLSKLVVDITIPTIKSGVWSADNRTLTSQGTGGGATVSEISSLIDTKQLATLAVISSLASDILTANSNISSIKGKTDNLTPDTIGNRVWTIPTRTLTSSSSGGITAQDLQAGLATYQVATAANITAAITTLTTELNQLNDISVSDLLNTVIEGTYTLVQLIRIIAAEASGSDVRSGSNVTILGVDGVTPRLAASVADTGKTITVRNGA